APPGGRAARPARAAGRTARRRVRADRRAAAIPWCAFRGSPSDSGESARGCVEEPQLAWWEADPRAAPTQGGVLHHPLPARDASEEGRTCLRREWANSVKSRLGTRRARG